MTRLAVLALPAAIGLATLAVGRPPAEAGPPPNGYIADTDMGGRCLSCHYGPNPGNQDRAKFVLLYESQYWKDHDLHSRAFDALTSDLGKRMAERLYGKPTAAATTAACLVCHATDYTPGAPLADNPPGRFGCDLGVNCQACHGPGDGWNGKHQAADWRALPPADKQTLGLANLRDPAVRAGKCVACHVGSVAEGKFVTHAMYAAGHPPLPAFELATFSRDEPKHWRQPAAVEYIAKLPPAEARALFSYRSGEVEAARLATVGAVTALRETAKLAAAAPAGEPLDFAHFNCAACHHELVVPSDRQRNGFPGAAGRPVPTTWPVWATRAVLRHPAAKDEAAGFEAAYEAWRKAFDAAPFGDRPQVTAAAAGVEAACEAVLKKLDAATFDGPSARSLITALTAEANGTSGRRDYLDADGAGQLARAAAAIDADLRGPTPMGDRPPPPPAYAGPLAALNRLVGLGVREADGNKPLLQARPTYTGRAERAFQFKVADFRTAFADFAKPRP